MLSLDADQSLFGGRETERIESETLEDRSDCGAGIVVIFHNEDYFLLRSGHIANTCIKLPRGTTTAALAPRSENRGRGTLRLPHSIQGVRGRVDHQVDEEYTQDYHWIRELIGYTLELLTETDIARLIHGRNERN